MHLKDIVETAAHGTTAVATILGGSFAYYRFVKGRVFKPRLTLTASARRICIDGSEYVSSTVTLSNVGLSRIDIGSADLRVCALSGKAVADVVGVPKYVRLHTRRVLLAHSWVESGETLTEQNLLILPLNQDFPILLDFRVVARGVSFSATTIAESFDTGAQSTDKRKSQEGANYATENLWRTDDG
jgi:hypothetical protein